MGADHVLERTQHAQVRHPVRSRPHRHPPAAHRRRHPGHHRRRVQLRGHPGRRPTGGPDPEPAQQRTHPGIHHAAVLPDKVAVAATTATATRSLHNPADRAAIVSGISCTNARLNPTNRSPKRR